MWVYHYLFIFRYPDPDRRSWSGSGPDPDPAKWYGSETLVLLLQSNFSFLYGNWYDICNIPLKGHSISTQTTFWKTWKSISPIWTKLTVPISVSYPDPYNFFKRSIPEADLRIRIRIKWYVSETLVPIEILEKIINQKKIRGRFSQNPDLVNGCNIFIINYTEKLIHNFWAIK